MRLTRWLCLLPFGLAFSFLLMAAQVQNSSRAPVNATNAEPRSAPPVQRYALGPAVQVNLGPVDDSVRDVPPARRGLLRVAARVSLRQMKPAAVSGRKLPMDGPFGALICGLRMLSGSVSTSLSSPPAQARFGFTMPPIRRPASLVPIPATAAMAMATSGQKSPSRIPLKSSISRRTAAPRAGPPPFRISELSHLWQFGRLIAPRQLPAAQAAAAATPMPTNFRCFLDASCYTDPSSGTYVPAVANAVRGTAFIVFGDSSGSYQCTGTLLNAPNASPLLLTAGHCINTQVQAQSLVAVFDAVDQSCTQPPFTAATDAQLSRLPQTSGVRVLSFSDQAFLDEEQPV